MKKATRPVDLNYGVAKELRARVDADGAKLVRLLYRWLDELNAEHFGGELPPVVLLLAATSSPRALGDHIRQDEHGIRYRVRIRPSCANRGARFVRDVLLHELVHVAQSHFDDDDERGYRGHGPLFAARCNAIGEKLGLDRVGARDRSGEALPDCAQWPINVRPAGYYGEEPPGFGRAPKPSKRKAARDTEDEGVGGRGRQVARALGERVAELEQAVRAALEQLEAAKSDDERQVRLAHARAGRILAEAIADAD